MYNDNWPNDIINRIYRLMSHPPVFLIRPQSIEAHMCFHVMLDKRVRWIHREHDELYKEFETHVLLAIIPNTIMHFHGYGTKFMDSHFLQVQGRNSGGSNI